MSRLDGRLRRVAEGPYHRPETTLDRAVSVMNGSAQFDHPSARPLRVLVADDNRDSTDSLVEVLSLYGCEVRGCYDGGSVLPTAERFHPDVCVLDVRMPFLDGWELAPMLRAWAAGRPLLLVALTGVEDGEANSRMAGFDHYILKPGHPRALSKLFAAFVSRIQMGEAVMV